MLARASHLASSALGLPCHASQRAPRPCCRRLPSSPCPPSEARAAALAVRGLQRQPPLAPRQETAAPPGTAAEPNALGAHLARRGAQPCPPTRGSSTTCVTRREAPHLSVRHGELDGTPRSPGMEGTTAGSTRGARPRRVCPLAPASQQQEAGERTGPRLSRWLMRESHSSPRCSTPRLPHPVSSVCWLPSALGGPTRLQAGGSCHLGRRRALHWRPRVLTAPPCRRGPLLPPFCGVESFYAAAGPPPPSAAHSPRLDASRRGAPPHPDPWRVLAPPALGTGRDPTPGRQPRVAPHATPRFAPRVGLSAAPGPTAQESRPRSPVRQQGHRSARGPACSAANRTAALSRVLVPPRPPPWRVPPFGAPVGEMRAPRPPTRPRALAGAAVARAASNRAAVPGAGSQATPRDVVCPGVPRHRAALRQPLHARAAAGSRPALPPSPPTPRSERPMRIPAGPELPLCLRIVNLGGATCAATKPTSRGQVIPDRRLEEPGSVRAHGGSAQVRAAGRGIREHVPALCQPAGVRAAVRQRHLLPPDGHDGRAAVAAGGRGASVAQPTQPVGGHLPRRPCRTRGSRHKRARAGGGRATAPCRMPPIANQQCTS